MRASPDRSTISTISKFYRSVSNFVLAFSHPGLLAYVISGRPSIYQGLRHFDFARCTALSAWFHRIYDPELWLWLWLTMTMSGPATWPCPRLRPMAVLILGCCSTVGTSWMRFWLLYVLQYTSVCIFLCRVSVKFLFLDPSFSHCQWYPVYIIFYKK